MECNNQPLVSIVIPVYNGANYLREAIESALSQTYKNCEILVINDGSNDQGVTETIALSYGDQIRYYSKENGGVASALNLGIKEMRGSYFSWLSHDDWYYPYKIQLQLESLADQEDPTTIVQGNYMYYDMDSQASIVTNFHLDYSQDRLTNSFFSVLQLQIHACSALIHKSHFERVGLFDESLLTLQDIEMWFRLLRGQRSIFVQKPLLKVREHREAGSRHITCYREETGKTYLKIISSISLQEMQEVFGEPSIFLCRMGGFLKSYGRVEEYKQIQNRMNELAIVRDEEQQLSRFQEYIKEVSKGKVKEVAIFGAGQYGIRICYELKARLIKIDYFIDNSLSKIGTEIEDIPCVALSQLEEKKDEILVIVACRIVSPLVEQLQKAKFPYIILKQQLDAHLLGTVPALSRKEGWI